MMKKTTWLWLLCLFCVAHCKTEHYCNNHTAIKSIFQFGDSFSDTGNALRLFPDSWVGKPPFGITIGGKPTGRFSDGHIIIDYIAKSLGLKSPKPYLEDPTAKSHNGANFAVAGVTALSADTLMKRWGLPLPFINATLDIQLQWFRRYLSSLHNNNNNEKIPSLKSSLMAIEIGGNDYTMLLLKPLRSKEATPSFSAVIHEAKKSMMHLIINKIRDAIKEIISKGATQVFVHGIYPYGCAPSLLTLLPKVYKNQLTYDKLGCLKEVNHFVEYHNRHLRHMLVELQERNAGKVNIIYADLYQIMVSHILTDRPASLGFTKRNVACCGAGGKYNYNPKVSCGDYKHGARACKEPRKSVFWDEWHITQATSKQIAKRIIPKILKALPSA